jgi:CHASE2 domain-containing sensor protein
MTAHARPKSFFQYYFPWPLPRNPFANPVLLVLLISILVARFEDSRIVVEMQSWSLDLFWGAMHPSKPLTSKDIYIVSINDSDYRNPKLFDSRSPLKPEKVKELLGGVLLLGPRVVGVDLDTKDPTIWSKKVLGDCTEENKVQNGVPTKVFPASSSVVVWARMPIEGQSKEATGQLDRPIQLYQVLGGCAGHELDEFSGVPRFPLDADGVVRKYVGEFEVEGEPPVESFARVIAEKYCVCLRSGTEEKILNFAHKKNFRRIASSAFLIAEPTGSKEDKRSAEEEEEKEEQDYWKRSVHGKIVLIGGEFEDSRDTHDTTPAQVSLPQPMYGVELNAMAIDSDLHGGAIKAVPRYVVFLVDFLLAGPLFVWIFFKTGQHPSPWMIRVIKHPPAIWIFKVIGPRTLLFVAATVVTFLLALGASWLLLAVASVWISFIPILIGANIHQYIEHAKGVGENEA